MKKRNVLAIMLVLLLACVGTLFADDDLIDRFATQRIFQLGNIVANGTPTDLQAAINAKRDWSGPAIVTINKNKTPAIAFYNVLSVPGKNQVLYIKGAVDDTTMGNLKSRDDAMLVNLIYTNGVLEADGKRVIVEYEDDSDDVRSYNKLIGGSNVYLDVEHMYLFPAVVR